MKVLITGHQGYIGPVLVKHLARKHPDWDLFGLDVGFFAENLSGEDTSPLFAGELRKDVRDIQASDLENIDAIVHLAAVSNDPIGNEFEGATNEINTIASERLAALARTAGVSRFVFASSCSMYGTGSSTPRAETDSLNPLTAYARSKVATEEALERYAGNGTTATCLRFATACGASPRVRLDLVLNDFVTSAVHNRKIQVLSDGTPWRPLIHTDDMARAIEWALVRDGQSFEAVNVGSSGWTWQMGQLANDVAKVLGDVEVSINTDAQPDLRSYRVDFAKFKRLAPDHQPTRSFDEAVVELADQVRTLDIDRTAFRNSKYIRLAVLRGLKEAGRINSDLRFVDG